MIREAGAGVSTGSRDLAIPEILALVAELIELDSMIKYN